MIRAGRIALLLALAALGALAAAPAAAGAVPFEIEEFDVTYTEAPPEGSPPGTLGEAATQAGSHAFDMTTSLALSSEPTGEGGAITSEAIRDIELTLPEGLVGNPTAVPRCSTADFLNKECPNSTAIGWSRVELASKTGAVPPYSPVYNLAPPPGKVAKLGWVVVFVPVSVELGVEETPPYNVVGGPTNISQVLAVLGAGLTVWGNPADPSHDSLRGKCLSQSPGPEGEPVSTGECPAGISPTPFLTLPRSCTGPIETTYEIETWATPEGPGQTLTGSSLSHDSAGNPVGLSGCGKLDFGLEARVAPTTSAAESASGLEIGIDVADEGIANPDGLAASDIAATRFELPEGMTANPSAAEGQGTCSAAQFAAASLIAQGCPSASKLGSLEVELPILEDRTLRGTFYLASQADNPFDSLLAAYLTIRDTEIGAFVKLPAEIDTDERTGRLITTVADMPQFPLSRVRVSLRQGPRAPLVTPPSCGTYETDIEFTPSAGGSALPESPAFEIDSGPGGAGCPSGNLPFGPGFEAGSENPAAAAYTPFSMRLTRSDGEQDLTKFSAVLPPGVTARLAGLAWCPDASIAAAGSRDGRDELASPSCPASSRVGGVVAGAGVGSALTYVDGSLYLAGPYNGAPLSVVAIVPAVAGPFDVGTVVTRVGLKLNPKTGQGEVDGAASDPIPHILEGIPLKVRDIRVLADRPGFTLNPTNCSEAQTFATIWGGGSNPFSVADDMPFGAASRFQAASCASLGFKPKLAIKLRGGVKRGAHPALRAVVTPPAGDANFSRAVVTLPRSAFLEQGHIRTICTRVQFAAGAGNGTACPPGSVYGKARAWSPLLDAPAEGPVFLRSSNNNLPDLVVALRGPASAPVDVELSARIDSVRGGIRSTFTGIPDLPVSRFILDMQGGKKGLVVNSRHLCFKPKRNRAKANLRGQNGRFSKSTPRVVAATCARRRNAKKRRNAKRARVSRALVADQGAGR